MTPELILFDCDGVLVDTEPATCAILAHNLTKYGLPMQPDECEHLFTGGTMVLAGEEARRRGASLPSDWIEEIYSEIFAELGKGVALLPWITELLDLLDHHGIAHCVASNGPPDKMRVSLTPSGLHDRFEGRLYSAYTHGGAKPSPAMLLHAAQDHDVDPARCVMIDDNPVGLIAALRAGMAPVGYESRGNPDRLRMDGAQVITDFRELPALIGLGGSVPKS